MFCIKCVRKSDSAASAGSLAKHLFSLYRAISTMEGVTHFERIPMASAVPASCSVGIQRMESAFSSTRTSSGMAFPVRRRCIASSTTSRKARTV